MRRVTLATVTLAVASRQARIEVDPRPAWPSKALPDARLISTDGRENCSILGLIEEAHSKASSLKREEESARGKQGAAQGAKRKRRLANRVARLQSASSLATTRERELRQLHAELVGEG